MKKYLFIVLLVASISNLKSDEIVIYSAASAQYYASGDGIYNPSRDVQADQKDYTA